MHHYTELPPLLDRLAAPETPRGALAATDADGTLWAGDLADAACERVLRERRLTPTAGAWFADELAQAHEPSQGDPHLDAVRLFELYGEGRVDEYAMIRVMTGFYAGWTEPELRAFGADLAREFLPHTYPTTVPLLRHLLDHHLTVVVVSGSPQVLVEEAVRALDLPAPVPVRGARLVLQGDRYGRELDTPITWHAGKVDAVAEFGTPAFAFGDTLGDRHLLDAATHLRVLVHPRPTLHAHAHTDADPRWCVFTP